ncbi:MAG: glutathione synthetase [Bacteroidota bacterium]
MKKYNLLVLTDPSNHSKENSLYALVEAMRKHPNCGLLDVASKANPLNQSFFDANVQNTLSVARVDQRFQFDAQLTAFQSNIKTVSLDKYDFVWLRLPPPLSPRFLEYLQNTFRNKTVVNDPKGIYETGSKAFLTRFPELCPPMQICRSIQDIVHFKNRFPIVLKPFRDYGGKGIVRIEGEQVWEGKQQSTWQDFVAKIKDKEIAYLGVKFLENVSMGDKRIIVVNGKIMGASLRLPAADSWLCNVAMGGSSNMAEVEAEEIQIVEHINPILSDMGIVMYGVDTLVGDEGKRILSEINTTSIGGLPQIARLRQLPLVEEATDLIWQYFLKLK